MNRDEWIDKHKYDETQKLRFENALGFCSVMDYMEKLRNEFEDERDYDES